VASWGLYTSVRCLANTLVFSVSLLAQGLGGFVFARIGGCRVCGFFLDLIGLHMVWSSLLSDAMYAEKASLFSSRSAPLTLLFALLNFRLSSGVCVFFCHVALALRFCATSCLICDGRYCAFVGLVLTGVAVFTACCRMSIISEDAVSMSSWVFELHCVSQFVSNQYLVLITIGNGRVKLGCRYVGSYCGADRQYGGGVVEGEVVALFDVHV